LNGYTANQSKQKDADTQCMHIDRYT